MMTEETPIACSLSGDDLECRLATIAEIGTDLISHDRDGDRHLLRFTGDATNRRRLEQLVAAESQCCPFLELALSEAHGELTLSIAASLDGQSFADGLAIALLSGAQTKRSKRKTAKARSMAPSDQVQIRA